MAEIKTIATLTCPKCGEEQKVVMPTNACQHFYKCVSCGAILKPKEGDCCVFCSYADSKCPPKQTVGGFMMYNKLILSSIISVLVLGGVVFFASQKKETLTPAAKTLPTAMPQKEDGVSFTIPKKAAHFESNTPEHGSTLAGIPVNVVINFNFDLAKGSEIKIEMGGKDYGTGETVIDEDRLAMRKKMNLASPNGLYTVNYKACWADGSCHDGSFQFKIDRSLVSEFTDQTNKKEVTINLQDIAFNPTKIKVSKGTKVTWVNKDSVAHTVNTDSHPAHTYYLSQNSGTLKKGDTYSVTFTETGIYPYHCTPHAASMKSAVLVE